MPQIIHWFCSFLPSIRRHALPCSFKASRNFLCSSSDHLSLCFEMVYGFLICLSENRQYKRTTIQKLALSKRQCKLRECGEQWTLGAYSSAGAPTSSEVLLPLGRIVSDLLWSYISEWQKISINQLFYRYNSRNVYRQNFHSIKHDY